MHYFVKHYGPHVSRMVDSCYDCLWTLKHLSSSLACVITVPKYMHTRLKWHACMGIGSGNNVTNS